ncbi:MAG: hypothetical protein KatS3mg103_0159 [Phycisphaerales bacterium]|nr:MAG: hypothetical protein KatS3mg103_0159 [Phycisphaerales bacterium]
MLPLLRLVLLAAALAMPIALPNQARAAGLDWPQAQGGEQASASPTGPGEPAGQDDQAADPLFDSPRSTLTTFLRAVERYRQGEGYSEQRAILEDQLAQALGLSGPESATAVNAAIRLHESLKRMERLPITALPDRQALQRAAQRGQPIDRLTIFPYPHPGPIADGQRAARQLASGHEIALVRLADGRWVFSQATVAGSEELFRRLSPLPGRWGQDQGQLTLPLRIERWVAQGLGDVVPQSMLWRRLAGVAVWKWLLIAAVVFAGFLADLLAQVLLRVGWWAAFARRGVHADQAVVRRAVRPFALLAAAAVWYAGQFLLGLPPLPEAIIRVAVLAVLTLSAVWAAYRVVDLACDVLAKKAKATTTKIDDLLLPLARKTAKVLITIFGVVYVASALDYEILPLLTGLGIGGLAVAFAAKDTIENFFGSIAVIADRPFEVGDWVVVGDVEGTVEELGIRSTRIRTFYDSLVTVPNATLVRATVDNYGRRRYRRFTTHVRLAYDTPPQAIEAFCEAVRHIVRKHPMTRKDAYHVYLNRLGDSSLDVLIYIFHACPDWATELRERQRFLLDMLRVAQRLGVRLAYPTQTLHLRRDDTDSPATPFEQANDDPQALARQLVEQILAEGDRQDPARHAGPQ